MSKFNVQLHFSVALCFSMVSIALLCCAMFLECHAITYNIMQLTLFWLLLSAQTEPNVMQLFSICIVLLIFLSVGLNPGYLITCNPVNCFRRWVLLHLYDKYMIKESERQKRK